MPRILLASVTAAALAAAPAFARTVQTTLRVATPAGLGAEVGTVTIKDSPRGAMEACFRDHPVASATADGRALGRAVSPSSPVRHGK